MESCERQKDCSHYGVDYHLVISVQTESLSVIAEEKTAGIVWKGLFPASYIEEITRRTGNFKRFGVFVKMVLAALDGTSGSVLLEVVSQAQMEAMRVKRRRLRSSSGEAKVYLILTYIVEFDKVHYPLPLAQEELSQGQQALIIRQLRAQIEALKRLISPQNSSVIDLVCENSKLREELARTRQYAAGSLKFEEKFAEMQGEFDQVRSKSAVELSSLHSINSELREELAKSRASFQTFLQEFTARDSQDIRLLKETIEELRAELRETKEEMQRYRQLLKEREEAIQPTVRPLSSRYALSQEIEEESESPQSLQERHQRLLEDEEEEPLAASAGEDIESRMQRMRDLLTKHAILCTQSERIQSYEDVGGPSSHKT